MSLVHWEIESLQNALTELKRSPLSDSVWVDCKTENIDNVRQIFHALGFQTGATVKNGKDLSFKVKNYDQWDAHRVDFHVFHIEAEVEQ